MKLLKRVVLFGTSSSGNRGQMKKTILMLFVAAPYFGQQQPIQDLNLLIGKQVVGAGVVQKSLPHGEIKTGGECQWD